MLTPIRTAAVTYARGLVGLTAPAPRYLALVAPAEIADGEEAQAEQIARLSDCALVAHGILDAVLSTSPRARYVIGRAVSDLVAFAREAKAFLPPATRPQPGDVLVLGAHGPHTEHAAMVVQLDGPEVYDPDAGLLPCWRVDGGQRTAGGAETILEVYQPLLYADGPAREDNTGRPVLGVIDLDLLVARWGAREVALPDPLPMVASLKLGKAGCLGKRPPREDPRTLRLSSYVATDQLPVPPACSWADKVSAWPDYQNDKIGDCTCASAAHHVHAWTASAGAEVVLSEVAVLDAYQMVGGYDPNDPTTDNGAVEIDVLNYWRTMGMGGHKIGAYVAVDYKNADHVRAAIALFGGLYIGLALPVSAQGDAPWMVPLTGLDGDGKPGSWGGHAVAVIGYDAEGLTCISWGARRRMTWAFLETYCDEAYAILSQDFLAAGRAPNGLDVETLKADLARVTAGH